MTIEDFTTYSSTDTNSDFTITASSVVVTTMRRDVSSHLTKAIDALGNFVHTFALTYTSQTNVGAAAIAWGLTGTDKFTYNDQDAANEGMCIYLANEVLYVVDQETGNFDSHSYAGALPVTRYFRIQRIGTALTVLIYTDSAMTVVEDTLSVVCSADTFNAVIAVGSREEGTNPDHSITFTLANLDLQVIPGGTVTVQGGGDGGVVAVPQVSSISPPKQQARKPYLNLKQSLREFFTAQVRYIKQSNRKESVFEKPYREYDYPSMTFGIPGADWGGPHDRPEYTPGDWVPSDPKGGGALPVPGCPGCAVFADPLFGSCESKPVEIHSGIWCTNTPGAATEGLLTEEVTVFGKDGKLNPRLSKFAGQDYIADAAVSGVVAGDTKLEIYADAGVIKDIAVGAWAFIGPSAAVYVDPLIPYHRICGRMVDGAGSICYACVDVTCVCDCTTAATFKIDEANTDDTIAPGGSATITVFGGCTPITWSVSGAGYVLGSITTEGRANTITSASGSCGTGAGQADASAKVTAIDACNSVADTIIRNTHGGWELIGGGDNLANCTSYAFCMCAATDVTGTLYHHEVGTGGNYEAKWDWGYRTTCLGTCDLGCQTSDTFSSGTCGGDTMTRAEAGIPTCPTACEGKQLLYFWTCGADC